MAQVIKNTEQLGGVDWVVDLISSVTKEITPTGRRYHLKPGESCEIDDYPGAETRVMPYPEWLALQAESNLKSPA